MHRIKCTVKSVRGHCAAGYQVGDSFTVDAAFLVEAVSPKTICLHALTAMATYLPAYARHTDAEDWINRKKEFQCPDNTNSVIFGVERIS